MNVELIAGKNIIRVTVKRSHPTNVPSSTNIHPNWFDFDFLRKEAPGSGQAARRVYPKQNDQCKANIERITVHSVTVSDTELMSSLKEELSDFAGGSHFA